METLEKIRELVDNMTVDGIKFFTKGNNSAGIRARKTAQEIKELLKKFRSEIVDKRSEDDV